MGQSLCIVKVIFFNEKHLYNICLCCCFFIVFSWIGSNWFINRLLHYETLSNDCSRSNRMDSHVSAWIYYWASAELAGKVSNIRIYFLDKGECVLDAENEA